MNIVGDVGVFALTVPPSGDLIAAVTSTPQGEVSRRPSPATPSVSRPPPSPLSPPRLAPPVVATFVVAGRTRSRTIATADIPGVWATLGNDPLPLPCGGLAVSSPANAATTSIGSFACPG